MNSFFLPSIHEEELGMVKRGKVAKKQMMDVTDFHGGKQAGQGLGIAEF